MKDNVNEYIEERPRIWDTFGLESIKGIIKKLGKLSFSFYILSSIKFLIISKIPDLNYLNYVLNKYLF